MLLERIGQLIAERLRQPSSGYEPFTPSDIDTLCSVLKPGDVLLIEGNQKLSAGIKYLTQSTWSHAALYVGPPHDLIEVNLGEGCVASPLSKYVTYNTRICRPVGLSPADCRAVVTFMIDRIGLQYDMKNIVDLMRYLLPTPPVPVRWRRRMIALGSGAPTKAICSSLIAQAFQSVRYPILPLVVDEDGHRPFVPSAYKEAEILHIRHHSLFTPRDFDLSPFFSVIKPTIETGFDYRDLSWARPEKAGGKTSGRAA